MLASDAQQSEWEKNVYVLTTTRIFVVAGAAYLCRSLYYIVTRYSGPFIWRNLLTRTSQEQVGVDLTNMVSDALSRASMDSGIDIVINDDLESGLQRPRQSYQSHRYLYRPRVHRHERPQRTEASTISQNPIAAAERSIDSRSGPANLAADHVPPIT